AQALGGSVAFQPDAITLTLPTPPAPPAVQRSTATRRTPRPPARTRPAAPPAVLQWRFLGARPTPPITAVDPLPGVAHFYRGADPAQWHTNLPTYAGIVYEDLYPGIALRFDGQGAALKSTYTVAPGSDPARIRWRYHGAAAVRIDAATGNLQITLPPARAGQDGPSLTEQAPIAWQEINGAQVDVPVRFALRSQQTISFDLGAYHPAYPLIIDPALRYSRFFTADVYSAGVGVAVDANDNVYFMGQLSRDTATYGEPIFVTKLDPSGAEQYYTTYIYGSAEEFIHGIAVTPDGIATLTGETWSHDFPGSPLASPPFNADNKDYCDSDFPPYGLCPDVFVSRLTANGALAWSRTFGGRKREAPAGIALDRAGHIYITGVTESSDFPAINPLAGPRGRSFFVSKVSNDGSAMLFSTTFGLSDLPFNEAQGIAVDANANIFIVGTTMVDSTSPAGAMIGSGGGDDAFVLRLDKPASADNHAYTSGAVTYLGGSGDDRGYGITMVGATPYIVGATASAGDFLATPLRSHRGGD
ncbi:MAG: hypothetical protein MI924_16680, partial [Chloroflexales bacterium]|nr:hypothetical protein [Chloroflexales bacterium]